METKIDYFEITPEVKNYLRPLYGPIVPILKLIKLANINAGGARHIDSYETEDMFRLQIHVDFLEQSLNVEAVTSCVALACAPEYQNQPDLLFWWQYSRYGERASGTMTLRIPKRAIL